MEILVKPDAMKAAQLLKEEQKERAEYIQNERSLVLDEYKMGNITLWASPEVSKDRALKPWEKFAREAYDGVLTLKAETIEPMCWMSSLGCDRHAHVWVHEIGFDLKEMKAGLELAQVSSADIPGPVPGFCLFHLASAPAMLAERVYFSHPAVMWGFLPTRWFVRFTDGTSQRGPIEQINPTMAQPSIVEQYINQKG